MKLLNIGGIGQTVLTDNDGLVLARLEWTDAIATAVGRESLMERCNVGLAIVVDPSGSVDDYLDDAP